MDRAQIEAVVKENKTLLTHWDDILEACLDGKRSQPFQRLSSVDDFIDGLQVVAPVATTTAAMSAGRSLSSLDATVFTSLSTTSALHNYALQRGAQLLKCKP